MGMAAGVNKTQGSEPDKCKLRSRVWGTHQSHSSPQQSPGHSYSHRWCRWLYRCPRAGKGCSRRDPRGLQEGQAVPGAVRPPGLPPRIQTSGTQGPLAQSLSVESPL